MIFDLILSVALLLSILVGVFRGALLEVLSLAALAAALAACRAVGAVLLPVVVPLMPGASALAVHAAAIVLGGIVVMLVGTAAAALIVRLAHRKGGQRFSTPNRVLGGAFGGVRAVVIWLVAACFVPPSDGGAEPPPDTPIRRSALLAAANRANPLLRLPLVRDFQAVQLILRDPERQAQFFALPETQAFLGEPRVAEALAEGNLGPAVLAGDLRALMRSPPFQAALLQRGVLSAFRRALAAARQ